MFIPYQVVFTIRVRAEVVLCFDPLFWATLSYFLAPWDRIVATTRRRRCPNWMSFPTIGTILFAFGFHHARFWEFAWLLGFCKEFQELFVTRQFEVQQDENKDDKPIE